MDSAHPAGIFIVEDSAEIRSRLVEFLGDIDGVEVVGLAETPGEAIEGIRATHPQWVVLDFGLRDGNGLEVLRTVHPTEPQIVFMVLSGQPSRQHRQLCLAAGASWYFDKGTEFPRIKDIIQAARALPH